MVRFGGNQFIGCSIPLAFAGRFFVLESDDGDLKISVFLESEGKPVFEILKNEPSDNPFSIVSKTTPGIITVTDRSGAFLYKVRPGSETSVVFGRIEGPEMTAIINDVKIEFLIDGEMVLKLENNTFEGSAIGILVDDKGGFSHGASMPPSLRNMFEFE